MLGGPHLCCGADDAGDPAQLVLANRPQLQPRRQLRAQRQPVATVLEDWRTTSATRSTSSSKLVTPCLCWES